MRIFSARSRHNAQTLALATVVSLLAACASPPPKVSKPAVITPAEPVTTPVAIEEVSLALPAMYYATEFDAVEQALARFDWMQAQTILAQLPSHQMSELEQVYDTYLNARIDYLRGDQDAALTALHRVNRADLHPGLRYRLLSFEHHMLVLANQPLASARLAQRIALMTPSDLTPHWQRTLWQDLQRAPTTALHSARLDAVDPQWLGWLELALVTRENTWGLDNAISQWRAGHPEHPAAQALPGGLATRIADNGTARKVALLLPLSGRLAPAGHAVLDGYLAAHYAAQTTAASSTELLILDTTTFNSSREAYDEALRQYASIVVGPLNKQRVTDLALQATLPIPVLALNRIGEPPAVEPPSEAMMTADEQESTSDETPMHDQAAPVVPTHNAALVQLALAPEDEAQRLAELAFGAGHRQALIVSPGGDWGDKAAQALQQRWQSLGGIIVANANFKNRAEQKTALQQALGLRDSEQRAQRIDALLDGPVEHTPRRRQDVDVIFMLARNGSQAQALKPLMAFLYAGDIPVYSISTLFNGVKDEKNRDLRGITLVTTPWLLDHSPQLRRAIDTGKQGTSPYSSLNALGADAFLLQTEFSRLNSGADALLRGNTGLLTMDPQLRIRRELTPATFDRGVLKPL